jgi:hypothetical protein
MPAEVVGDEIVVTFPFSFLREKLGDPQRRIEIQEALSEVLGAGCRVKLVLASEHIPRQQANPSPSPASQPSEPVTEDTIPDELSRWAEEHGAQVTIVD